MMATKFCAVIEKSLVEGLPASGLRLHEALRNLAEATELYLEHRPEAALHRPVSDTFEVQLDTGTESGKRAAVHA